MNQPKTTDTPQLFRKRDDEQEIRHDVEGTLSPVVSENHAREDMHEAGSVAIDHDNDPTTPDVVLDIEIGQDVVCRCGHKLGEVVDYRDGVITVEKGFFVTEDLFVPETAIDHMDHGDIVLNVTKSEVKEKAWDEDPDAQTNLDEDLPTTGSKVAGIET